MSELTLNPSVASESAPSACVDVMVSNFVQEVLEASKTQIVVVDFWAPWCGPCKQLGPVLERVVAGAGGAAKLAKIDIDKNAQIAQQMRIQSIPAVFAFFNKQVVDGFMGALPEPQIKAWLDELIKATGAKAPAPAQEDFTAALEQAAQFRQSGDIATARAIYSDILTEQPGNKEAFAGVLHCLIALGDADSAAALLAKVPSEISESKELESVRAALDIAMQAQKSGGEAQALEDRLRADEKDYQAHFDLALLLFAQGKAEEAIDHLLFIVSRDRKWEDDGARKQLVQFFEALGATHELTIAGRKKLSSVLFS